MILQDRGRLEEAVAMLKKEEALSLEMGNKGGLQRSYGHQALILQSLGRLDEGHGAAQGTGDAVSGVRPAAGPRALIQRKEWKFSASSPSTVEVTSRSASARISPLAWPGKPACTARTRPSRPRNECSRPAIQIDSLRQLGVQLALLACEQHGVLDAVLGDKCPQRSLRVSCWAGTGTRGDLRFRSALLFLGSSENSHPAAPFGIKYLRQARRRLY